MNLVPPDVSTVELVLFAPLYSGSHRRSSILTSTWFTTLVGVDLSIYTGVAPHTTAKLLEVCNSPCCYMILNIGSYRTKLCFSIRQSINCTKCNQVGPMARRRLEGVHHEFFASPVFQHLFLDRLCISNLSGRNMIYVRNKLPLWTECVVNYTMQDVSRSFKPSFLTSKKCFLRLVDFPPIK